MKKLILPLVMGLILGSCSRDNEENITNNNSNEQVPILPTKIVDEESTFEFRYNVDKLIEVKEKTNDGADYSIKMKYDGDKIVEMLEDFGEETSATTFNYINDKLSFVSIKLEHTSYTGKFITDVTRRYTYNSDGTIRVTEVSKGKHTNSSTNDYETRKVFIYTLSDNNSVVKFEEIEGGEKRTALYTYDNHHSPFKNVKGFDLLHTEFGDNGIFSNSKNNVLTAKVEFSNPNRNTNNLREFSYDYNSYGYPIKRVEKFTSDENNTPSFGTMTFTYNK